MKFQFGLLISVFGLLAVGCGGGGSSPSTTTLRFATPIMIAMPTGHFRINGASPNGQLVGTSTDPSSPMALYWSAPNALFATLSENTTTPTAINDAGTIVGVSQSNQPIRWSSYAAASTPLSLPAGFTQGLASSINTSGQSVGYGLDASGNRLALSWDAGSGVFTLSGTADKGESLATFITDDGTIFGQLPLTTFTSSQYSSIPAVWTSVGGTANLLSNPAGTHLEGNITTVNPTTKVAMVNVLTTLDQTSTANTYGWAFPYTQLVSLSGNYGVVGFGSDGTASGNQLSGSTPVTPLVWQTVQNAPSNINSLIPAGTGWVI